MKPLSSLIITLLYCWAPAFAAQSLNDQLMVYPDKTNKLTLSEIKQRQHQFTFFKDYDLAYADHYFWFKVTIPGGAKDRQIYIENQDMFNYETVFFAEGKAPATIKQVQHFSTRDIQHRYVVFKATLKAKRDNTFYFRVFSHTILIMNLAMHEPEEFKARTPGEYHLLGIFLGAILIMAIYNLSLGIMIRDPAYLFYALYSLSTAAYMVTEDGLLLHFFLGNGQYFGVISIFIYCCIGLSGLLFLRNFSLVKEFAPWLDRLLFYYSVLWAATFIIVFLPLHHFTRLVLVNGNFLLLFIVSFFVMIYGTILGRKQARILLIAFSIFLVMASYRLISVYAFGMANLIVEHGVKIGVILELTILSVALANRYNDLKKQFFDTKLKFFSEKENFSREIHDTIGTQITSTLMSLRQNAERNHLEARLANILEDTRDFASVLNLREDSERSFSQEVYNYFENFKNLSSLDSRLEFDEQLNAASVKARIHSLRILQEWVNNCMRHGKTKLLHIRLMRSDHKKSTMLMLVTSNGAPFSFSLKTDIKSMGQGLKNIQYRCKKLQGNLRCIHYRGRNYFLLKIPL